MADSGASEQGFHFYCYGVVVEDKPEGTPVIEVYPKEFLYNANGSVDNTTDEIVINRSDSSGKTKTDKMSGKTSIPARWFGLSSSNRVSSPDVCKGESVVIIRYGTNDDYFWEPITTEIVKRGRETVCYLFKNDDTGAEVKADGSNSYSLTFSTRHKFVNLHLANNDGEPVGYDVNFNTKQGIFSFQDTRNNLINLNSPADYLKVNINKQVDVNTKILNVNTEETNIVASKKLTILTPDMNVKAKTYVQEGTSYTLTTTGYSVSCAAGKLIGSGSGGFNFDNLLIATDLKTNAVNSVNNHVHGDTHGGNTTKPNG